MLRENLTSEHEPPCSSICVKLSTLPFSVDIFFIRTLSAKKHHMSSLHEPEGRWTHTYKLLDRAGPFAGETFEPDTPEAPKVS